MLRVISRVCKGIAQLPLPAFGFTDTFLGQGLAADTQEAWLGAGSCAKWFAFTETGTNRSHNATRLISPHM